MAYPTPYNQIKRGAPSHRKQRPNYEEAESQAESQAESCVVQGIWPRPLAWQTAFIEEICRGLLWAGVHLDNTE